MIKKIFTKFNRRPFPRNMHALRSCRISYSQFGEDLFLSQLLGYEKTDGNYVDIGCYSSIDYSNTYIFYQRGWSGLVIDPNKEWQADWEKYRKRDKFICCAVSNEAKKYSYIRNSKYPACNRLSAEENPKLEKNEEFESLRSRRINDIFEEHEISRSIDFMNIDCEGQDIHIPKDLDFDRWSPQVIAAEDSSNSLESDLNQFLNSKGYKCESYIGLTKIFRKNDEANTFSC